MSKKHESLEHLKKIADRCTSEADVMEEVANLSYEEKMRMVFGTEGEKVFERIKKASVATLEFCEDHGLLNDYERQTFKRDEALGILRAVGKAYELSTESLARQELQAMSEQTQFGAKVANEINDLARELSQVLDELTHYDCLYAGILRGRQMNTHYLDDEGSCVPFTQAEINMNQARELAQHQEFNDWRRKERLKTEMVFDGTIDPLPLPEGEDALQLKIPLWK